MPASEVKKDKFGGEYKTDEGTQLYAIWIPISAAEKEALIKKGEKEKVDVPKLAANFLRQWLKEKELSDAQLEKVAGGSLTAGGGLNLQHLLSMSPKFNEQNLVPDKLKSQYSTVMCPW